MPMGGVSLESVQEYFKAGSCALGVGSELVSVTDLGRHGGADTARRAREFRRIADESRDPVGVFSY
jgi:2-keto-3-deoxy-6-phosphogluconate aldolase